MTKHILNIRSATLLGMMLITANTTLLAQTSEQSTTTVKTVTSAGILSEFGPKEILIRTEASPDPIHYTYTKTTTYVDENGAPVSMAVVKSGLPVTVYYVKTGDQMVASKVIVRKVATVSPSTETTTTEVLPTAPAPMIEEKKTTTTTTSDK